MAVARRRVPGRQATVSRHDLDARRVASGCAPTPGPTSWSSSPLPSLHRGTDRAITLPRPPPPNPTAAGPDGRRVLSRGVGAADHTVTPKAPWTGSGWHEYSSGGFEG